jgi:5-methylcytosine-specific restriction endonuclease McrA
MQRVFVLSHDRQPLDPCHPARARKLLGHGRAAVFRLAPFTIMLRERTAAQSVTHPLRVKIDPGSRTTGLAVVNDATGQVVWASHLEHRGQQVHERLVARASIRRHRRQRHTRYRPQRFLNRRRPTGWLPPSLERRIANATTWVARLRRWCPVGAISQELVTFDTHLLANPEISGVLYQQGTLSGYEVREYLLEQWGRTCAYCGATGAPFEVDHIIPQSRPGGTDRVSTLCLACHACNQAKGNRTPTEWRPNDPRCQTVAERARQPLHDAAAVNTTRWALYRRLEASGLPVEAGTGGRTTWNRTHRGLDKTHWLDAACVGASTPDHLLVRGSTPLAIRAMGRGNRQVCRTDAYGVPIRHRSRVNRHFGFAQGDVIGATVPRPSIYAGSYLGRVGVRASGKFDVVDARSGRRAHGIHHRHCRVVQRADGYQYGHVA